MLWARGVPDTAWGAFGALALGALAASLLERRWRTPAITGVALLFDNALVGALAWAIGGAAIAYWLFVLPLVYALHRSGAAGGWLGGVLGGVAVYLTDWLRTGALPTEATTLSWAGGLVGLGGALGWLWQRRVQAAQDALLEEAARAIEQSEAAERRIRESYRELAHHYHRLEEHLTALQDAAELLHALQQAREPESLLHILLERLRARFGASGAVIYLTDETGAVLQAAHAIGALAKLEKTAFTTPVRPFQKRPALQSLVSQIRAAVLEIERLAEAHHESVDQSDAIVVPLMGEGCILGVVALTTCAPNGFSPEVRTRVRALAPHLSALLTLVDQMRLMSARLAETQTLYELENLLFSVESPRALPQRALAVFKLVLPYEHAQLLLSSDKHLELVAQEGAMPPLHTALPNLSQSEPPVQACLYDVSHTQAEAFAPATSLMIAPLRGGVRVHGLIALGRTELPAYNALDLELLQTLAFQLTSVLERALLLSDLERLAVTDGLTGLYNYRHFQERYREEVNLCRRYHHPLAIMLIDLDGFKQVNDTYGHLEGDYLLVQLADVLRNTLRNTELIARYGGDEFVVLMPSTNLQGGVAAANRVLQTVRETLFWDTMGAPRFRITLSIGVAAYPNSTQNPVELLEKADEALETAKRGGRNRIVASENIA
ncbi:MAG: diguanylate cyclase [Armatimonadetes bacterium]|nr:diguanylate cyclase [Armatimonadota bacterium]